MTLTALAGAAELGLDESDVVECVLRIAPTDFYKSMPAIKAAGLHQDVYRTRYGDDLIYVKVQLVPRANPGGFAVVIQFKEK